MKRAIIIGATSGIGQAVAKKMLEEGWIVGIAGRRENALETFRATCPDRVYVQVMDVTQEDAPLQLMQLITRMEGMDLFLLSAGTGKENRNLHPDIELETAETNVNGFIRMVTAAYRYFKTQNAGHLAVISSVAGTKGMASAPAYSATKRFQNTYMDALAQLIRVEKRNIQLTDIRPGFVDTALLNSDKKYPMLMQPNRVAALIVQALKHRKRATIIDWRYALLVIIWRFIPQWLWERMRLQVATDKE
ncbi:MAG: SDR family NAD(P)-dependent oxidoreductase [Tannerella sp.]|jgi:short-subunit dehydrogenase|nr:SDR family NAD(P)-dependent oxidoreductase [Tannerella sp.]